VTWDNQAVTELIVTVLTNGMSGIFGYSPEPGAGNLLFSLTAAPGTDQYGNAYESVLDIGAGVFQVDDAGNMLMFNPAGNLMVSLIPTTPSLIIYQNTSPVQGPILFAFAGTEVTDTFGNTIGEGTTLGYCGVPSVTPGPSSILLYCDGAGNLQALTADGNTRLIAAV